MNGERKRTAYGVPPCFHCPEEKPAVAPHVPISLNIMVIESNILTRVQPRIKLSYYFYSACMFQ